MPRKRLRQAAAPALAKRPRGRPRRDPQLVRLTVYIPGELKRWLQHRAIDMEQDLGHLVTAAVAAMRARSA